LPRQVFTQSLQHSSSWVLYTPPPNLNGFHSEHSES
jgi:hypothetical protein